jgi:hypothetical protein
MEKVGTFYVWQFGKYILLPFGTFFVWPAANLVAI